MTGGNMMNSMTATQGLRKLQDADQQKIIYAPRPVTTIEAYLGLIIVSSIVIFCFILISIFACYLSYTNRLTANETVSKKTIENTPKNFKDNF